MKFVKILKWILIAFVGSILALYVASYVFKDKVLAMVKEVANDNLNAKFDFEDLDLSLIRSFPKARVTLTGLSIVGIDTFENVKLIDAEKIYFELSVAPFFNKKLSPSISFVSVEKADLNILILADETSNYLISKESSDSSKYELALEAYEFLNSRLTYTDQALDMKMTLEGVNHSGSGNLSTDIFDLDTKTTSKEMTVDYEGMRYLSKVDASFDALINTNLPTNTYTLKKNKLRLNELNVTGDGVLVFRDEDMDIDFSFKSDGEKFKDIVSVLPFLMEGATYDAKGTGSISGLVKGNYNPIKALYPAFNIAVKFTDGEFKSPDVEYPIKNINADINIASTKADMSDMTIKIPKFNLSVNGEAISGNLMVVNGLVDPRVEGALKGTVNLSNWKKALPLQDVSILEGKANIDLSFKAKMSDIEKENYDKIAFNGNVKANGFNYKANNQPKISMVTANALFNPAKVEIATKGLVMGKSSMNISGSIENPLAIFAPNAKIKGNIKIDGSLLDLNEWQQSTPAKKTPTSETSTPTTLNLDNYSASELNLDVAIKKILYGEQVVDDLVMRGKLGLNTMDVSQFSATVGRSDFKLDGKLVNLYDFMFKNEMLTGQINLNSNKFDANQFMQPTASDTAVITEPFIIPRNIDLAINTTVGEVKYTNIVMKQLNGLTVVKDGAVSFIGMNTQMLGGQLNFDGMYNSVGEQPGFSMKLDLAKMRMEEAYSTFVSMKALAPVAKYIKGLFNTTLVMDGSLDKNMNIVFNTLNASGFLETINSALKNSKIFDQIGDKLGIESLKNINLENSKNWFDIKDGAVQFQERVFNIGDYGVKVSGTHKIKGDMDYTLLMKIPRAQLEKTKLTSVVNKGWTWLEKEAEKTGINLAQGEFIDLRILLKGRLDSPNVSITPMGTSGKTMEQEIKDEVTDEINKKIDSLKTTAMDKKDRLQDTILNRANSELDKAKDKAVTEAEKKGAEIVNEAKDAIKKEVGTKLDSTFGVGVTDSLNKKATDLLKDKTGVEVQDIKKKLEDFNPFKKKKTGGGND
jgi:hypothetical protein